MSQDNPTRTNYFRRSVGIVICFLPVELGVTSLIYGLFHNRANVFLGYGFLIVAAVVAVNNFYCAIIRPWLYSLKHKSKEEYRFVSGLPVFGDFFVIAGIVYGFGAIGTSILGILITALNLSSLPWFLFATWRDKSFWDEPRK